MATTVTTAIDLAKSVDISDAVQAGLMVVGMLVTVGISMWGARLIMDRFYSSDFYYIHFARYDEDGNYLEPGERD
jgi:uncharacterized membrane protein YcjF (UPF0283 family)